MLFSETKYEHANPIQAYGKNFFRVKDQIIKGGIFIFSDILKTWKGFKDLSFLDEDILSIDILFIGTGKNYLPIDQTLRNSIDKYGIIHEIYSTPVACRAYNVTISGHRKAGALMTPIMEN